MRHRYNRLKELDTGIQKRQNVIRNLLTSLVLHGQIVTTPKRADVLKSQADRLFSAILDMESKYENLSDARREAIRVLESTLYTKEAGKKVMEDLVPKYKQEGRKSGFTNTYRLGFRSGDSAEKVLVKLV